MFFGVQHKYLHKILTGVHIYAVVYHHHCPPVHNIQEKHGRVYLISNGHSMLEVEFGVLALH